MERERERERESVLNDLVQTGHQATKPTQKGTQPDAWGLREERGRADLPQNEDSASLAPAALPPRTLGAQRQRARATCPLRGRMHGGVVRRWGRRCEGREGGALAPKEAANGPSPLRRGALRRRPRPFLALEPQRLGPGKARRRGHVSSRGCRPRDRHGMLRRSARRHGMQPIVQSPQRGSRIPPPPLVLSGHAASLTPY